MVLHKCDNPSCVRPEHLYLGTATDNARDMVDRNRTNNHIGEDHAGAKLTKKAVLEIRSLRGKVSCRYLAEKYGVGRAYISDLQARKTWKHI